MSAPAPDFFSSRIFRFAARSRSFLRGLLDPDWESFINDYPDRIMLGADEFVGNEGLPAGFENTWGLLLPNFEPEVARKIGVDNAAAVYSRIGAR